METVAAITNGLNNYKLQRNATIQHKQWIYDTILEVDALKLRRYVVATQGNRVK